MPDLHLLHPPEGFNTQPPEGGWEFGLPVPELIEVSTHSRPKAAGLPNHLQPLFTMVSTHSRPKAAGVDSRHIPGQAVCFNTQPPEGGWAAKASPKAGRGVSTHSRPKAAGFLDI